MSSRAAPLCRTRQPAAPFASRRGRAPVRDARACLDLGRRGVADATRAAMAIISEARAARAYDANPTDALDLRAQELRHARPNLRLDVLTQIMVDHCVDWVILVDQHVIVTRFELGHRRVLGLESSDADTRAIPRAITTNERATIAHAASLMVHEHIRQLMIVPDHQPALRLRGDRIRTLPGGELATERPLTPTVGLYFTTATQDMCDRLEARQAQLDARAPLVSARAAPRAL
ncbi:MAG: hypothetical protein ABIY55_30285 [Kofleriaceae bacterium]